jgi:Transmembrane domain of unknown function (DUF3566)
MTETQAMSETAGSPTNPAEEHTKQAAAPAAAEAKAAEPKPAEPALEAKLADPKVAESRLDEPKVAKGRAKVRAEVPDAAIPSTGPTFTRPAGMPMPPPDDGKRPGKGDKSAPPLCRTAMGAATLRSVVNSATAGAVRVTDAVRAARTSATVGASRGPRRARLSVKRVDPWSVMKFSFAVSFVLLVVIIVATSVLYLALDAMGVFDSVNKTLAELFSSNGGGEPFKITATWVIGVSAILGAINVVLFTALMTLGAFVYNVCADLVGGVEVTLAERE